MNYRNKIIKFYLIFSSLWTYYFSVFKIKVFCMGCLKSNTAGDTFISVFYYLNSLKFLCCSHLFQLLCLITLAWDKFHLLGDFHSENHINQVHIKSTGWKQEFLATHIFYHDHASSVSYVLSYLALNDTAEWPTLLTSLGLPYGMLIKHVHARWLGQLCIKHYLLILYM